MSICWSLIDRNHKSSDSVVVKQNEVIQLYYKDTKVIYFDKQHRHNKTENDLRFDIRKDPYVF